MIDHVAEQAAIDGWNAGNRAAGAALLKMHAGVIVIMARKHVSAFCEEEDLIQEASIALLGATSRYTPDVGKFITYARRPIKWACNDYARELRHDLHVSKGAEVAARSFGDPRVRLSPVEAETARVNRTAIELAMIRAVRLDDVVGDGNESWMNRVSSPANDIDVQLDIVRMRTHVVELPARERGVLLRRCTDDPETHKEIGETMGVSRQRVEQIEKDAVALLRKRMTGRRAA